jgi:heptosyltransferase III
VSLPAIAQIRRQHPNHRLTLLTESAVAARVSPWTILKETGWFDDVHFYVVRPGSARERWHNFTLAMHLRRRCFDQIFSLAPPRTARQLRVDAGIFRGIVGARRYHASRAAAWPTPMEPALIEHEALRLLRIVDPNASEDILGTFRLAVPDNDRIDGHLLLDQLGVRPDQMLIGVAPGSARATTSWPADRFAAVGGALLRQFRNAVLLAVGGSGDRPLCDQLCDGWGPRSHNLAGRLSVFGSASVMSRCTTLIGNDSGATHLAAMVGVPCVAIFSARNARGQWTPLGPNHVIVDDRPECAGCMLDDCIDEQTKCLTRIEVARVFREATSLIEARGTA